jgi:glycosyltransferase involved in cell wall biosynthesis
MIDISIIIPIFNEEANIDNLYKRLLNVILPITQEYELIFVNDGSTDGSFEKIKTISYVDDKIKFIDFSRNFGHQIAVTAGLDKSTGKAVVIIDADLQDPPEVISDLYKKLKEGYQVVYAKRKKRQGESLMKRITAKVFYRILAKITSITIPVDTGDFRIIERKVVDELKRMPEQQKFLRGQISWVGFKQTFVEYDRDERQFGKTGYSYAKMFKLALDGITSFSEFPLKVATLTGFIFSGVSFLLIIYALYGRFVLNTNQPGWTSLMLSVSFIGGIQLLSIGIIGEYIGRIGTNIRNRPLYIINESNIKE